MSDSVIRTEQDLQVVEKKVESLGTELNASQGNFKIAMKATIQQAANIGRIASDAREYIKGLPTQRELAKILGVRNDGAISYEKRKFSYWISNYTDLGQTTIYNMMSLYEALKNQPDFEPPKDMSWRDCLAFLTGKEKSQAQINDEAEEKVVDIIAERIEEVDTEIENKKLEADKFKQKVEKLVATVKELEEENQKIVKSDTQARNEVKNLHLQIERLATKKPQIIENPIVVRKNLEIKQLQKEIKEQAKIHEKKLNEQFEIYKIKLEEQLVAYRQSQGLPDPKTDEELRVIEKLAHKISPLDSNKNFKGTIAAIIRGLTDRPDLYSEPETDYIEEIIEHMKTFL